ncbi:MarR family winged helix-turn-helix transcriptional regulator [Lentilactobacillus buchneri]|uniref:Transcriptional regulator, MarR family n=1 Tax=Lentilactobacillus buchneri subsp. silagei CD034 TaxID=1071400 RepID=J9VYN1_LENBU|nr:MULTISPECIES: winged helix DNA-binding protein [Lentilactobacillus]AFR99487.1 transcriptional regulator, MarR family [Lentilactobacillus buchneri subsp. silagei CD034]MCV3742028.1 winged helix DNA-binding protein [Lentilactobacillus hilgardii]
MKKKNAIEQIKNQLEIFRSHDVDREILAAIRQNDRLNAALANGITINDLHIIRAAAAKDGVKISAIVDQVPMTQGAVSKAVNKLAERGLLQKSHHPDNRKDTFVELTAPGETINQIHSDYHRQEETKLAELADSYSKNELEMIAEFVTSLNQIRQNNSKLK